MIWKSHGITPRSSILSLLVSLLAQSGIGPISSTRASSTNSHTYHLASSSLMLTSNLNPGGRIEMIDILYPLQSDDGTLTKDSASLRWSELLLDIFTKNNT